jgi:uncharacterized protein YrzB (UPF0473 family)
LPERDGAGQYWQRINHRSSREQWQLRQLCDCIVGPEPNGIRLLEVGANTEVLTVTDVNGNSTTCSTTITVEDNVAPVAVCQNITVQLDNSGNATITASQINNGSNDACGIQSLALNITIFNCANVNGNTVILTVTDVNSNTSTCSANVTIEDNVAPIAVCQNVTVQLDNTGNGSTTAASVNNGSSDNCAIATLALSQTTFVCSEVGANTEILTVTDVNGNSTTCSTTITVEDNVAPVAVCQSITVQLDNTLGQCYDHGFAGR